MYNQIISSAGILTDSMTKTMITQREKSGEITTDDANIIRKNLGL